MPCSGRVNWESSRVDRDVIDALYNLEKKKIVRSTVGFMTPLSTHHRPPYLLPPSRSRSRSRSQPRCLSLSLSRRTSSTSLRLNTSPYPPLLPPYTVLGVSLPISRFFLAMSARARSRSELSRTRRADTSGGACGSGREDDRGPWRRCAEDEEEVDGPAPGREASWVLMAVSGSCADLRCRSRRLQCDAFNSVSRLLKRRVEYG